MTAHEVMGLNPGKRPGTEDSVRTTLWTMLGLEVKFPAALEATADYLADYDFMALVDSICRDLLEKEGFTVEVSAEARTISGNRFRWCSVVARICWGTRFGEYKVYAEAEKITVPGGTVIRLVNLEVVPVKPVNR